MRKVTNDVISAVEDGLLDWEEVARACLNYLSEDDVEDMVRLNGWAITDDELFDDLESEDADFYGAVEDVAEDSEDDFVFVSEMRHEDYVIEFFRNKQDGKYYWQAEYDGEDRKLSNFDIWIATRGISLYSEDDEGYPTKADVVAKAKEWVNKQKDRW